MAQQSIAYQLDKMRYLRLNNKALAMFEQISGRGLSEINLQKMSMMMFHQLVWAMLIHEDPDLTVDDVFELIEEHSDIEEGAEKITQVITEYSESRKKKMAAANPKNRQ